MGSGLGLGYDPETSKVPSQLKSTPETGSECAGRILRHLPLLTSHRRSDSSKDPEASRFPCEVGLGLGLR